MIAVAAIGYGYVRGEFDTVEPNKVFEVQVPDGRIFEVHARDMQSAAEAVKKLPAGFVPDKSLHVDGGLCGNCGRHRTRHSASGANSRSIAGVGVLGIRCHTDPGDFAHASPGLSSGASSSPWAFAAGAYW